MTLDRAAFVAVFPEFKDASVYPDAAVNFWINQAGAAFSDGRMGAQTDQATMLFVAHNLTLGVVGAKGGGASSFAPVSSKSVGPVSKSYDTSAVTRANAGIYNGTPYGQRLWALLSGMVAGGFYRPSARAAQIRAAEGFGPYGR